MTRASGAGEATVGLAGVHGADLHRLAAMLTADTWRATELTGRVLAAESGRTAAGGLDSPETSEQLKRDLVKRYLRSAPRRVEDVPTPGGDAGDVLRGLRPRARAAAALRLVEGWDTDRVAGAVGASRRRVEALVPRVPGLDLALAGLADRHALVGADLRAALLEAMSDGPGSTPVDRRWRRWAWAGAAALPVALLLGYAVQDREEGATPVEARAPEGRTTDLTAAGWRLDDDGDPPGAVMGLRLRESVRIDKGRRSAVVDLPARSSSYPGVAAYAVLWCDMPPAQDDHLRVPSGTLTVAGNEIGLPCAGRDGTPPVSRVAPLPLDGEGVLEIEGDMPGDGVAVVAVYTEDDPHTVRASPGSSTDAPPVTGDSVVLDLSRSTPSIFGGRRLVEALSVEHDSTVRVWAGRSGSVSVTVDGVPATDDGDVSSVIAMLEELSKAQAEGQEPIASDPLDHTDWSTQEPDLRDGRWLVPAPGEMRTFELPSHVRPGPGERRTVAVEVVTEHVGQQIDERVDEQLDEHLQVAVTGATRVDADLAPVMARTDPEAPEMVVGHRLVGEWELPSDGLLRELRLEDGELPDGALLMLARESDPRSWFSWGEGAATRGGQMHPLWLQGDLESVLRELRSPWHEPLPDGPGPVSAAAPPVPGHLPATILAYVPVPYEDFDFAGAALPPDAWPTGTLPPPDSDRWVSLTGWEVQAVLGPEDLEDGRVSVPVRHGAGLAARVGTEGKGRIRFLVEGRPADALHATDGWWSSWTDQAVTTELELTYSGGYTREAIEVTVVVEDHEDFTVELLTG